MLEPCRRGPQGGPPRGRVRARCEGRRKAPDHLRIGDLDPKKLDRDFRAFLASLLD